MQTKLITLDISLRALPSQLRQRLVASDNLRSDALRKHIENELAQHGDPLRWAITRIDSLAAVAHVEAVVTTLS